MHFASYISELGKPETTVRGTSLHSFPQKERFEVFKLLGWVSISSEQESWSMQKEKYNLNEVKGKK